MDRPFRILSIDGGGIRGVIPALVLTEIEDRTGKPISSLFEAKKELGADDVLVVSLGTGELTRRIAYEEAKEWGLVGWAGPILGVVFDGVSDTVDFQTRQLCAEGRY